MSVRADAALSFQNVTFTYPEGERPALAGVTVDIPDGGFVLALGATGAGKSTFLRSANGLVPHFTGGTFAGRVFVAGRDTLANPPRRLADVVAFVPQDAGASFVLDGVEDEIAYGMENLGVDPAHMRRRVEEMLDLLDIAPLRHRSLRRLSGGERQRVAIAAALAAGPRILVLDEPTSQLDPQGAEHVMAALQRLVHDHGMTVLLAEHRLERVVGWVDGAVGFREGHAIVGTPREVIRALGVGPPVARLGRMVGWDPVPLTVRDARTAARTHGLAGPRANGDGQAHPRANSLGTARPPAPAAAGATGDALAVLRGVDVQHEELGQPRPALRDISFTLSQGEIVAVMGRNGAGKTTLLRTIAGVLEPKGGDVRVLGHAPQPGVDVGLCPQEPESVLFNDSVAGEVRATLRARHLPDADSPWLGRLGIAHLAARHPRELSAGQRLLVATAAIAATGAPIILLDEPTRGLDPESKEHLCRYLRAHAAEGGGAMFATHDVELAAAVATRVIMLANGELIADGTPADVLGDSHVFAPQMTRVFGSGWLTPEQVAEAMA